ncbi:Ras GTPase-activating protein-binding protein 1, partial [Galemys pyrenaicus]
EGICKMHNLRNYAQILQKTSSYVHGRVDSNGRPADAICGQEEIHRKVMAQNFIKRGTKACLVAMGLTSNSQALRRFMQTFVLAPGGSFSNRLIVHKDALRRHHEQQEGSEEEVEEPEERQQTPEVGPDGHSGEWGPRPCSAGELVDVSLSIMTNKNLPPLELCPTLLKCQLHSHVESDLESQLPLQASESRAQQVMWNPKNYATPQQSAVLDWQLASQGRQIRPQRFLSILWQWGVAT